MVSWISSIIRRRRSISYIATTEASSIDSTCTIEYYDDTYYEGSTRYDYNKIKDLIKDIKTKKFIRGNWNRRRSNLLRK